MVEAVIQLSPELRQRLAAPGGPLERYLLDIGQRIVNVAKQEAPVDTGRLRQSITSEIHRDSALITLKIGSDVSYAKIVHNGHKRIVPVQARVLSWVGRGGVRVFARSVRAVAGRPFLSRAVRAVIPSAYVPDVLP